VHSGPRPEGRHARGADEAVLVSRAAGGDRAAFHALVERHRPMVYRVAYQFAGNHHDADDIAQDVFIKVFQSLGRFRQDANLTTWLYRIAMNACIDHRRRQTPHLAHRELEDPQLALDSAPAGEPGPEDRAAGSELGAAMQTAVDQLPPRQRLIFVMRHYEGMKLHEIAAALGLQDGTVKRQLHTAVHRLRRVLAAHGARMLT
jgi:RNA polymerase sigma-70 factor (ECF subfamily)